LPPSEVFRLGDTSINRSWGQYQKRATRVARKIVNGF